MACCASEKVDGQGIQLKMGLKSILYMFSIGSRSGEVGFIAYHYYFQNSPTLIARQTVNKYKQIVIAHHCRDFIQSIILIPLYVSISYPWNPSFLSCPAKGVSNTKISLTIVTYKY
jgi:hypothetical protein